MPEEAKRFKTGHWFALKNKLSRAARLGPPGPPLHFRGVASSAIVSPTMSKQPPTLCFRIRTVGGQPSRISVMTAQHTARAYICIKF